MMVTKRSKVPVFICTLICSFLTLWVLQTIPFFWFFFFLFQIGDALIEIASNIMLVDDHVLWMAQKEDKACTRIVRCVEQIAGQILTSKTQVISKVFQKITKCFVRFFFSWILFARPKYFLNITNGIKSGFLWSVVFIVTI